MLKRKVYAWVIAGLLTMGLLAGCGQDKEAEASKPAEKEAVPEEKAEDKKGEAGSAVSDVAKELGDVTMIISNRDEFLSELESGAIEAAKDLGVNLTTVDAQNDQSKLLQFVESARNNDQKVILVNIVDAAADACKQIVETAGDMKVVFVNRIPDQADTILGDQAVYVGSDESTAGYFQGEALAKYFKEKGQTDVKYILIQGTLGQVSTTNRSASLLQALEDNGINAVEATAPLVADWDRATAQDMVTPLLTTIEYDFIAGNCDALSLGAVEAMKSQGLDPASIPIVGIDASTDGRQAIHDGDLYMTVFQNAKGQGYGALRVAANFVSGKELSEGTIWEVDETGNIVWIPFEPVTKENVDQYDNYTLDMVKEK